MSFDPKKIAEEAKWLIDNPQFDEKPASIREFVDEDYLNIANVVRPGILDALVAIFGEEVNPNRIAYYERAMVTGGIGIGKTTFASIALPYMAHWVLCMKNPQSFFNLMPGSRIAFMQMSTSGRQAEDVVFGDIFARIKNSPWFVNNYPHDEKYTKVIKFAKDIWILPGDSSETTFEGYNILAGILDEMDSHKITDNKDYADVGFDTIESRIASRYVEYGDAEGEGAGHKGLIICIGQMKKSNGFAARKLREFTNDPKAHVTRMTIWESLGWQKFTRPDGTRASFWYDTKTKKLVPSLLVGTINNSNLIEIPNAYKKQFETNPEKALRDLAGIPPTVNSPFISMVDRIEECRDKWIERFGQSSPVKPDPTVILFEDWFKGGRPLKHTIHLDFGLTRDAMGVAMGHVEKLVKIDGEEKPYIIIDFMARLKARPGQQIMYSDVRQVIYRLKDDLNFRIVSVTKDGFQSVDTEQQLRKRKFHVEDLSLDKSTLGYEDLREAIYEHRLEFPPYMTYMKVGDDKQVEIAVQELMMLQDTGKKIDHPPDGSKDVADAMAGVVTILMGDRTYRRGVGSGTLKATESSDQLAATGTDGLSANVLPFPGFGVGLQAPVPEVSLGGLGLSIPDRLRPRRDR